MLETTNTTFINHTFKMNETIDGAIKLINGYQLLPAEMILLREMFNGLNGEVVPRPGQTFKIPIWTLGTCLYKISNT